VSVNYEPDPEPDDDDVPAAAASSAADPSSRRTPRQTPAQAGAAASSGAHPSQRGAPGQTTAQAGAAASSEAGPSQAATSGGGPQGRHCYVVWRAPSAPEAVGVHCGGELAWGALQQLLGGGYNRERGDRLQRCVDEGAAHQAYFRERARHGSPYQLRTYYW
jgi:hypothetical protein